MKLTKHKLNHINTLGKHLFSLASWGMSLDVIHPPWHRHGYVSLLQATAAELALRLATHEL